MSSDFMKLIQLHEDFDTTWAAFNTARHDAGDLIAAVRERLQAERKQNAERAEMLEETTVDPNRSETVRRVAEGELSRIREHTFSATPEEVAAFAELVEQQECALQDLREIQADFQKAFTAAKQQLEGIRADVVGNQSMSVAPNWIAGQRAEFARLCEEGKIND